MIAKHETGGPCEILRVSGRIDFESALDFEQQVNAMLQKGGDCFIIELSEVELLSSAGLRVLLSTAKRVTHRNAELALAAPSQVVRQVFEISHFNLLFKIFPSVNEAIAALKGAGPPKQPSAETTSDDANDETSSAESGERPATTAYAHRSTDRALGGRPGPSAPRRAPQRSAASLTSPLARKAGQLDGSLGPRRSTRRLPHPNPDCSSQPSESTAAR